jgi:hypothetical protein
LVLSVRTTRCFRKYHADLDGSAVPVFFGCWDSYGRWEAFSFVSIRRASDFWERENQVFESTLLVCDVYTMNMVIFFFNSGLGNGNVILIGTLALPAMHGAADKGIRYANGGGI